VAPLADVQRKSRQRRGRRDDEMRRDELVAARRPRQIPGMDDHIAEQGLDDERERHLPGSNRHADDIGIAARPQNPVRRRTCRLPRRDQVLITRGQPAARHVDECPYVPGHMLDDVRCRPPFARGWRGPCRRRAGRVHAHVEGFEGVDNLPAVILIAAQDALGHGTGPLWETNGVGRPAPGMRGIKKPGQRLCSAARASAAFRSAAGEAP
jgi:hypothetical protein